MIYQPSISEAQDLYSSYLANCVFSAFLSYTAIILNIVTIFAITRTSSLLKPQKTLLLSLAASDLGVGLWLQPFYTALLVNWLQNNAIDHPSFSAFTVSRILFTLASFFSVTAIGVDRFSAIHLHLRYHEFVTHKRVVAVVILIWFFSVFISLTDLWFPQIASAIVVFSLPACFISTMIIYGKTYLTVRRHRHQINEAFRPQQLARNDETAQVQPHFSRVRKSTVSTFYVYLVFMICYLPRYCCFIVKIVIDPNTTIEGVSLYTFTLMLLNSSLNPLVYCWKMRHIRRTIIGTLRSIFQHCQAKRNKN